MFELFGDLFRLLGFLLIIGAVLAVIAYDLRREKPLLEYSISHWHTSIPQLNGTTRDFYKTVTGIIESQKMPGVVIKLTKWHEGSILSDKRDYLRIRWGDFSFDLCVAPFGNTLFASSWLCQKPKNFLMFLTNVPFLSWFAWAWIKLFDPETYYKIDAGLMFQGAVHACVLSVLDEMITSQGAEPLHDFERKPIMREMYGRPKQPA